MKGERKVSRGYKKITPSQIAAIGEAADIMEAMIGCGDSDKTFARIVKSIDSFLEVNGLSREYGEGSVGPGASAPQTPIHFVIVPPE